MFNCKPGDILLRVVPPHNKSPAYSQAGKVIEVTDDMITMEVQVDIIRKMTFDRSSGMDRSGIGSYIVQQDLSLNQMVSIQQAWEWAGGNPGVTPTIADLKLALNTLDQVCDEVAAPVVTLENHKG